MLGLPVEDLVEPPVALAFIFSGVVTVLVVASMSKSLSMIIGAIFGMSGATIGNTVVEPLPFCFGIELPPVIAGTFVFFDGLAVALGLGFAVGLPVLIVAGNILGSVARFLDPSCGSISISTLSDPDRRHLPSAPPHDYMMKIK